MHRDHNPPTNGEHTVAKIQWSVGFQVSIQHSPCSTLVTVVERNFWGNMTNKFQLTLQPKTNFLETMNQAHFIHEERECAQAHSWAPLLYVQLIHGHVYRGDRKTPDCSTEKRTIYDELERFALCWRGEIAATHLTHLAEFTECVKRVSCKLWNVMEYFQVCRDTSKGKTNSP